MAAGALVALCAWLAPAPSWAQSARPNILVIWGDDIGMWNLSAYHRGMLGSRTPNIDRIAKEGALFTDYYAEQSCTAGRSAFVTGQHPLRTDPFETSMDSGLYTRFMADQLWLFVPMQQVVGQWLATFRAFPPRQPTASFTIDKIMQQMQRMAAEAMKRRQ